MSEFKKPLVSLIVTCHNLGKYLPQCIKSIENQTYKNFEIIIVDDFSDEKTKKRAQLLVDGDLYGLHDFAKKC